MLEELKQFTRSFYKLANFQTDLTPNCSNGQSNGHSLTPVHYVVLMAPVDGFDKLVDVVPHFVRRNSIRQLFQQLQHVLHQQVQKNKTLYIIYIIKR